MFNASLVFCSVVSTDWIAYSGMETPVLYQDALADMKARTKANVDRIAGESRGRGFKAECFVGIGGPADEIQRIATEHGVGLIVMSTHGRSGPSRWVMGSTANALVRRTHLPCLLVRSQHTKHHPPDEQAEHLTETASAGRN